VIGEGSFGRVILVRKKSESDEEIPGGISAVKIMNKTYLEKKN
jgi:hypothetical protein